ncbi:CapA family protein [Natronosalvus caseinilyticus]|uniref:CapA family protein n=1 Tax=Natronosalvus caseinilyticus TaxID=2953747 RepID=UPI0028A89A59|nr:CapA family protein [Natronosalvus caseinilyticus]
MAERRVTRRRAVLASGGAVVFSGCVSVLDRDRSDDEGARGGNENGSRSQAKTGQGRTHIGFVGDVMLARGVEAEHADGDPSDPWEAVLPYLESLDGLVGNLECCLSTRGERFPDRAFYFRADPSWAAPALSRAGFDALSLANNHLLDYGPTALLDTLEALDVEGIAHAGAGEAPEDAYAPTHVSVDGVDLAVVSIADHFQSYGVTDDRPGTAYLECDPTEARTRVRLREALSQARAFDSGPDLVVVSVHWGPNWVEYPETRYRKFARYLIDSGADVVHGHSAHVFQGVETYNRGVILHDTGDFVDDYVVKEELRNDRSYCFELVLEAGELEAVRLVPIEIDDCRVHHASDDAADWARDTMRERSDPFETDFERDDDALMVTLEQD